MQNHIWRSPIVYGHNATLGIREQLKFALQFLIWNQGTVRVEGKHHSGSSLDSGIDFCIQLRFFDYDGMACNNGAYALRIGS